MFLRSLIWYDFAESNPCIVYSAGVNKQHLDFVEAEVVLLMKSRTDSTSENTRGSRIRTWVFPKIGGKPPKWMVKIMENPIKMDDLGVFSPYFWKHPLVCYDPASGRISAGAL